MAYADDILLVHHDRETLLRRYDTLKEKLLELDLNISPNKSALLSRSTSTPLPDGIPYRDSYQYLGENVSLTTGLSDQTEICDRVTKRLTQLKFLLKNPHIGFSIKRNLYIMLVRAVITSYSIHYTKLYEHLRTDNPIKTGVWEADQP